MGSGQGLLAAIKKYGRENFKTEVLRDDFKSMDEAYEYEAAVITPESLDCRVCYNRVPGGRGISDGMVHMSKGNEEIRIHKNLVEYFEQEGYVRGRSEKTRKNISRVHKGRESKQKGRVYLHRGYSEEIRVEAQDAQRYLDQGYKYGHSQLSKDRVSKGHAGNVWINDGISQLKQIKSTEKIPEGWYRGRFPMKESSRQKLSEKNKGHTDTDDTRERKRNAKKGRTWKLIDGRRVWSPREDIVTLNILK